MSPAWTRVLVVAGALPAANIAGSAPWPASSWSFWSSEACGTVWIWSGSAAFSVEHAPAASFLSSPGTVVFSALLSTVNAEASCPAAAGADVCPVAVLPAAELLPAAAGVVACPAVLLPLPPHAVTVSSAAAATPASPPSRIRLSRDTLGITRSPLRIFVGGSQASIRCRQHPDIRWKHVRY